MTNNKKSIKRVLRQLFFIPVLHSDWLNKALKNHLSNQIELAEKGHQGEIFIIIENHLPIKKAYRQTPRMRALELFASERVWDTEANTGVLVYINVCEHDLEIVADRGINKFVEQKIWQDMCNTAISGIKENKHQQSLSHLLQEISQLLQRYHALHDDIQGNEISNQIKHIH